MHSGQILLWINLTRSPLAKWTLHNGIKNQCAFQNLLFAILIFVAAPHCKCSNDIGLILQLLLNIACSLKAFSWPLSIGMRISATWCSQTYRRHFFSSNLPNLNPVWRGSVCLELGWCIILNLCYKSVTVGLSVMYEANSLVGMHISYGLLLVICPNVSCPCCAMYAAT